MVRRVNQNWELIPLPDKGHWFDRHKVKYEGREFYVARFAPRSEETAGVGIAPAVRDWCGWSSDPALPHVMGEFTGEKVLKLYAEIIDKLPPIDLTPKLD